MNLVFKIGSRIFAAAVLIVASVGVISLASTRSLPFLPEEGQEYSIIYEESSAEESFAEESREEEVSKTEASEEPSAEEDISKYLEKFDTVTPDETIEISKRLYDSGENNLVKFDVKELFGNNEVTIRYGYFFLGDGRIFDSYLNDITSALEGYEFVGAWCSEGYPLLKKNKSYYYLDSSLEINETEYDIHTQCTGFDFDVPIYLCEETTNIKRIYSSTYKKYGYRSLKGYYYCNLYFTEAFAFAPYVENGVDRSIGCVIRRKNGEDILEFYMSRFRTINDERTNLVISGYYPPEDRSINSIGYFYFCNELVRVRVKNSDGSYEERIMNPQGELTEKLTGYNIAGYSDGIILQERNGKYGYTTTALNWITNPEYTEAHPFLEGFAVVKTAEGKYGIIGTDGKYILEPKYDKITDCSGGVMAVYSEQTGWAVLAKLYNESYYERIREEEASRAAEESAEENAEE